MEKKIERRGFLKGLTGVIAGITVGAKAASVTPTKEPTIRSPEPAEEFDDDIWNKLAEEFDDDSWIKLDEAIIKHGRELLQRVMAGKSHSRFKSRIPKRR